MEYLKDKTIWLNTTTDSFKCLVVDVDTTGILVYSGQDYTNGGLEMQPNGCYDYVKYNEGLAKERYYPFTSIKEIVVIDVEKMIEKN